MIFMDIVNIYKLIGYIFGRRRVHNLVKMMKFKRKRKREWGGERARELERERKSTKYKQV